MNGRILHQSFRNWKVESYTTPVEIWYLPRNGLLVSLVVTIPKWLRGLTRNQLRSRAQVRILLVTFFRISPKKRKCDADARISNEITPKEMSPGSLLLLPASQVTLDVGEKHPYFPSITEHIIPGPYQRQYRV
ncbi:uncharacterized protein TM35_000022760 [Trypanosoma theileri]|uniref:Uncharacterized protein n=1 Tax=Trypanosoma theileri TaxID=67003 RepID=A0A1X0P913_9TRYP|nr:uncharacterized protein TM35_000022760 [Trypanosoma theileri]ORC92950.1 hypothetical protein TM35_000022760 [Trypanosoma theileri]